MRLGIARITGLVVVGAALVAFSSTTGGAATRAVARPVARQYCSCVDPSCKAATGNSGQHETKQPCPKQGVTISISPSAQSLAASGTTTYTVTITPVNGFAGQVSLTVAGLPGSRVTGSFSPNPSTATSTSTLTLTSKKAQRHKGVTLTITGSGGSYVAPGSATVTLNVA